MNLSKITDEYYPKLCRIFSEKNITEKNQDDLYSNIIFAEYKLTKNQQKRGAYLISTIFFSFICIIYYIRKFDLIYLFFFTCIGLMIFFYFKNYFKKQIQLKEYELINYFQFLIVQINIFLRNASLSHDRNTLVAEMLTLGPCLSPNIDQVFYSLSFGESFQKSMNQLIFYSPAFTKFFQIMIKFNFDNTIVPKLNDFNSNYEKKKEIFIQSLDTKLSLFFFFSIFYPIGVFYYSAAYSISLNTISMLVLIYYISQELILKKVLDNQIHLLGDVTNLKSKKKREFEVFLDFFLVLGRNLVNSPPEIAIFEAINSLDLKAQNLLRLSDFNFSIDFLSLNDFLNMMSSKIHNNEISQFLNFLLKLLKFDSSQGYNFLIDTLNHINSHQAQIKKQEIAFKNAYAKSNLFKILLALILGILTPFIIKFQSTLIEIQYVFNGSQDFFFENSNLLVNQPTLFILEVVSISFLLITITSFNRVYIKQYLKKFDFIVLLIYILFNLISNILLKSMIL